MKIKDAKKQLDDCIKRFENECTGNCDSCEYMDYFPPKYFYSEPIAYCKLGKHIDDLSDYILFKKGCDEVGV